MSTTSSLVPRMFSVGDATKQTSTSQQPSTGPTTSPWKMRSPFDVPMPGTASPSFITAAQPLSMICFEEAPSGRRFCAMCPRLCGPWWLWLQAGALRSATTNSGIPGVWLLPSAACLESGRLSACSDLAACVALPNSHRRDAYKSYRDVACF